VTTIDRARLAALHAEEEQRFVDLHPTSAKLAADAGEHLLAGVPMPWMTRWPGSFPLFVESAGGGRFTDVDGIDHVDLCLGDTGSMTGHCLPQSPRRCASEPSAASPRCCPRPTRRGWAPS
jgi:glutamate-1-semialdehyde 2,1-aminomutase